MQKVIALLSCVRFNLPYGPGHVFEINSLQAAELIEAGYVKPYIDMNNIPVNNPHVYRPLSDSDSDKKSNKK